MTIRVMHASLWRLMGLQVRARLRRLRKLGGTWKGRFLLVIGLVLFAGWLFGSMLGSDGAGAFNAETLRSMGAAGLAVLWVLTIVFGRAEGGIAFRPAEVDFLFPAPIPRRHLLLYRIISASLISLPSALLFSVIFRRNTPLWLGAFIGIWLTFQFIMLSQVAWQLIAGVIEQSVIARSKRVIVILAVLGVLGVAAAGTAGSRISVDSVQSFVDSTAGRVLLAPFLPYSSVLAADSLQPLGINAAIALAINLSLICAILRLDGHFMEASVHATQRLARQVAAARSGRVAFGSGGSFLKKRRVPVLPRLGGAGPIAWQHMTALLRSAGGIAVFVAILGASIIAPAVLSTGNTEHIMPILAGMSVFMLPQFVQYDFRAEVDRIPVLKSLPLSPLAVVAGEVLTPVLAVASIQMLGLLVAVVAGGLDPTVFLLLVAFCLPADLLVIEAENLVFLWFPFRASGPGGGQDVQTMFRVWMTMILKFALIGVTAGIAAGAGGLTYWATSSEVAGFSVAWVATCVFCIGLLPALGAAFVRFDPALDTPG